MMARSPGRLHWTAADNTRLAGKMQLHYRLAFDGEGRPMFQVFRTCKHFVRTIPALVYDESNVEDVGYPAGGSHLRRVPVCPDGNPITPPARPCPAAAPDDPLDLRPGRKAVFYRI